MELKRQIGFITGILIIVADMIGTGIFLTTGNVLGMTNSALIVLALWILGGIVALTGALSYAEMAAMWPDAGGEYVYLKNTFGYLPAFLTGWISLIVGFSAPVATSALLLFQYLNKFFLNLPAESQSVFPLLNEVWMQKTCAAVLIVFFGIVHMLGLRKGGYLQNVLTLIKILIVGLLIILGFYYADWSQVGRLTAQYVPEAGSSGPGIPTMGLSLLIVMFAYSGWNCAAYMAGEIRDPNKNLPRILLWGALITTVIYFLVNVVFLISADGSALMGKDEVGAIAAKNLFGTGASSFFTLGIAVILLSAVSAQMMVGPRVYYAMAKDRLIFGFLEKVHPKFGTPYMAIVIQTVIALLYVYTGSAITLVIYMGFALNIFPVLAVIGLIVNRIKKPGIPRPYSVPFYPLVPLVYIVLSITMMIAALLNWTKTSLFAIGVVLIGVVVFYVWQKMYKEPHA